ncbi:uncharacterized protein LOC132260780 [Phlebotomus argentipes]|uniref:uncharacterized protein LOC132260780 n=1 Tax=Phlebotomus argentipes TaxID=94469 RepID=UPI002892B498|nr:uncharacterized protein LOC132260780 [Phlebotomus argentipes]
MELSLAEIRNFMLNNGCKVTNHALVKHFKEFLTNPDTQNEARKQFKTYVNILATIRTEDKRDGSNEKEKYLILKPKYLHECPSEDNISLASGTLMSPASRSISSEMDFSPSGRQPPPYRPPPDVSPGASGSGTPAKVAVLEPQTRVQYKDCINEYRTAIMALQRQPSLEAPVELRRSESQEDPPQVPPRKRSSAERSFSIEKSSSDDTVSESNKENVAIMEEMLEIAKTESENKISVKEATKKFNKIASEEEKIISPSSKKKPEKIIDAEINDQEALVSDPKAKEWLVSAARCNYQELSKLASDNPRLVKLREEVLKEELAEREKGRVSVVEKKKKFSRPQDSELWPREAQPGTYIKTILVVLHTQGKTYGQKMDPMCNRKLLGVLSCFEDARVLETKGEQTTPQCRQSKPTLTVTETSELYPYHEYLLSTIPPNLAICILSTLSCAAVRMKLILRGPEEAPKDWETQSDDDELMESAAIQQRGGVESSRSLEWIGVRAREARRRYQEGKSIGIVFMFMGLCERERGRMTALHWAAKHGNENVVKLIAGTYKANANAQTNGGYTPLHISMQFGRDNIFELLQNVYKVDRDILDWSGKKALDYRRQKTAVSASTYSKIKAKKKHTERESGFLRIGSLRNFLGVGSSHHHGTQNRSLIRSSVPSNKFATSAERFDKLHKSWGSADNLPHNPANMPPPKNGGSAKKRRTRRHADYPPVLPGGGVVSSQSQSMPTTPNQPRAPIHILSEHPQGSSMGDSDSDSACGFDSNWSGVRPTYI